MNLQTIQFPKAGICNEQELYFRLNGDVSYTENSKMIFDKGSVAWFDTYFNSFSIGKWKKYTQLKRLFLRINFKGSFIITILSKKLYNDVIIETAHLSKSLNSSDRTFVQMEIPEVLDGMIFFKLEALEENSEFYGGEYFTNEQDYNIQETKIGIVICTYKREKFIERNVDILKQYILDNNKSPLYNNLYIFISDNGKSLDIDRLSSNKIFIFPNKNAGGAGGFTRGLIEILKNNNTYGITHALLMDDDIIINPESLVRTYNFLRLIKDEYKDAFIGGSMLRLDFPNIQVESGAIWNAGKLLPLKGGLDLNICKNVLFNEIEEYTEYNAWWYCCVPMTVVKEDNLPLPIFIRGDDLEYGLRNKKHVILLNGICVWHEPFENKYSSFLNYYIIRNLLIDNTLHYPNYSKLQFLKLLFKRVVRESLYYKYKDIHLMLKGTEDFLKGIDWLKREDPEKLHKEIMENGYKVKPIEKIDAAFLYGDYMNSLNESESKLKRFIRLITMNGYLLPAKYNKIVSVAHMRPINFYRAKKVIFYDHSSQKAFVTEKSFSELLKIFIRLFKITYNTFIKFDYIKTEYRERMGEITNIDFWSDYLELNENKH